MRIRNTISSNIIIKVENDIVDIWHFKSKKIDNFQMSGIGWHARIGPRVTCAIGEVQIWEENMSF